MANIVNSNLASQITGSPPPRSFTLDSSVLEYRYVYEINLDDTKRNRIEFVFPAGFNTLDLFEECRAMRNIDDFDSMFNITMMMLEDKDVIIYYRHDNGEKQELCKFHVTDMYQDLRGVEEIDKWPILITWLTEFVGGLLLKKCPTPGKNVNQPPNQASKGKGKRQKEGQQKEEQP